MAKVLSVFKKIDDLRAKYYELSQGKEQLLNMISEAEIPEQVYNSNAIENSTLTLEDTEKILLQIDLDKYVSDREIFEAKNLARVVEYINKNAKDRELNKDMILFLHKTLMSNIRDDIAGRFRKTGEFVRVRTHIAPAPEKLEEGMQKILLKYKADSNKNIIKRISDMHLAFEHLHPFVDGNGRIGRVLNNYLLIREGYIPINIKFIDRQNYYNAFKEFDVSGQSEIMQEIVGLALTNSYHKRLAYLENKEIITLREYAQKSKQSHANVINKAKRQTIPAFREKGVWKIGV
ncbi:MAG: Fic family protein [Candidatus Moranbacteria bacterium]|nr:Fic family protein [Candidatus Moranbacteria bacterium]